MYHAVMHDIERKTDPRMDLWFERDAVPRIADFESFIRNDFERFVRSEKFVFWGPGMFMISEICTTYFSSRT